MMRTAVATVPSGPEADDAAELPDLGSWLRSSPGHHVRDRRTQFDVGILERLRYARDAPPHAQIACACARDRAALELEYSTRRRPCSSRSTTHSASLTSVLRPGTF